MQNSLNTAFIEGYSRRFSAKITDQLFENNDTIAGKQILSATPSKQVNFFILKILFTKWQDELKALESPYFNYKDAEVRKAMMSFMNVLSQKIEVNEEHFESLLEEAVMATIGLIADPAGFVMSELAGANVQTEKQLKNFLKYIKIYKDEVTQALELVADKTADEAATSIADFFESLDLEKMAEVELGQLAEVEPVALDDIFVSEADDEDVLATDEETPEMEGSENFFDQADEEEEAQGFVEKKDDDEVNLHEEQSTEEEPEAEEQQVEEDTEPDVVEDEVEEKEPDPEPEPVVDEVEEIDSDEEEIEDSTPAANEPPVVIEPREVQNAENVVEPKVKTVHETFEEEEKVTVADHHEQAKVHSILEAISVNNRYMFTKELFDGDQEQFEEAVESLDDCISFDDAVEMLVQDYAKNLDWDMNSPEVKELLKVVFRKFR